MIVSNLKLHDFYRILLLSYIHDSQPRLMILSVNNVFCLGTMDMDKIMFLCRWHCLRSLRHSHCL